MVLWIVTFAGILSNFRESAESPEITARFEKEAYYQRHREEYILDIHTKKDANLKNLRIAALCSLAFAGFFRYDELCNIVPKHIEFHSDYIRIFVPRSKTDVYREGNFVFISASRSKYCPVGVLQRYLDLSGIDLCSSLPLFRPLVFHRSSSSYTLRSGKISYTTCRDILRDTLSQLGLNPNDYGLHSLRSGGITSAVRNSSNSIPERLLKIHGRWKSDSAKDMYVEESLENRLQVTKYLGL